MSLEDNHSWQMLLVVTVALPATVAVVVVVVVATADVVAAAAAIAAADSCNAFTYFRNCLYLSLTQMHKR